MAGKQSAGMARAQKMVTTGKGTPPEAARKHGVALQSIYRTTWYREWRAAQKAAA